MRLVRDRDTDEFKGELLYSFRFFSSSFFHVEIASNILYVTKLNLANLHFRRLPSFDAFCMEMSGC